MENLEDLPGNIGLGSLDDLDYLILKDMISRLEAMREEISELQDKIDDLKEEYEDDSEEYVELDEQYENLDDASDSIFDAISSLEEITLGGDDGGVKITIHLG